MRLEWLLDRLLGLAVVVWGFKAARVWWHKHPPPQRGPLARCAALATYITIRFGLTTAFPGLERRLQWKTRLSRSGVIRYIVFKTVWWTVFRAWGIRRTRRRIANPQLP